MGDRGGGKFGGGIRMLAREGIMVGVTRLAARDATWFGSVWGRIRRWAEASAVHLDRNPVIVGRRPKPRWRGPGSLDGSGEVDEQGGATSKCKGQIPPPAPFQGNTINQELCLNCNLLDHFAPRWPTIHCDRCGKLGHMAQLCQALRPWECIPAMCGFQSPSEGFFYFPDLCIRKNVKERNNIGSHYCVGGVYHCKGIRD